MSFGILTTFIRRMEKYGEGHMPVQGLHHLAVSLAEELPKVERTEIATFERPPIREIEEYQNKFSAGAKLGARAGNPLVGEGRRHRRDAHRGPLLVTRAFAIMASILGTDGPNHAKLRRNDVQLLANLLPDSHQLNPTQAALLFFGDVDHNLFTRKSFRERPSLCLSCPAEYQRFPNG